MDDFTNDPIDQDDQPTPVTPPVDDDTTQAGMPAEEPESTAPVEEPSFGDEELVEEDEEEAPVEE